MSREYEKQPNKENDMAKNVKEYIRENESRFLNEWFSLIRIPTRLT